MLNNKKLQFTIKWQMKDKILEKVHEKMCNEFETNFLPRKKFDKELSIISIIILEKLNKIIKEYQELINNSDKSVVKFTKNEYIVHRFSIDNRRNYRYIEDNINVTLIKSKYSYDYKNYGKYYDDGLANNDSSIVIPVSEFVKEKTIEYELDNPKNLNEKFWYFFHKTFFENPNNGSFNVVSIEELIHFPQYLIQLFSAHYLKNNYISLFDIVEKHIDDITFSPFDSVIVNVGDRNDIRGNGGWSTNEFKVINNKKAYSFILSSKDKKNIRGKFINIFVLNNKYLTKISVTLEEDEQTKYIVWKDCEKVTVKNESELFIEKHHGNETIIFDTRKDALAFRDKIIEIKEGGKSRSNYWDNF